MNLLFDKYTAAFNALDAAQIAGLYTIPCATSDGDGQGVYTCQTKLQDKFATNCTAMKAMSYSHAEYRILNEESLGAQACAVTIGWKVFTKTKEIEFSAHYVCHKLGADWKIFMAQVY